MVTNYTEALQNPIFEIVKKSAEQLGVEAYVIGGFVRDFLLKRGNQQDIDIVCVGSGIELANLVANSLPKKTKVQIFKTYGTAMLKYNGVDVEFVGARKESYNEDSRNPIVESGTLEDDQMRRDFTINAMAFSLCPDNYGNLIDPFGGVRDLDSKTIKTPLDPEITYNDDPLRMLRAVRFATQLNFRINRASLDAIEKLGDRLKIISRERVADEVNKIMLSPKPSSGFITLYKTGILERLLPELTVLNNVEEIEGQSHKNNFYHTLEVLDNLAANTDNLWLRWAALLHDIGKAPTKKFMQKQGWTFHGHEFKGSKMVKNIFERLHLPTNTILKYVQKLVMMSSRPIILAEDVTDSAVRRLIFDAGEDIEDLMLLCEADITTKNPAKFKRYHSNFQVVRQKMVEVEERDQIRNFQPPISGEQIMEMFNLKPSREVGILKETIKEAILEGEIPNSYEAAYKLLTDKASMLGLTKSSV